VFFNPVFITGGVDAFAFGFAAGGAGGAFAGGAGGAFAGGAFAGGAGAEPFGLAGGGADLAFLDVFRFKSSNANVLFFEPVCLYDVSIASPALYDLGFGVGMRLSLKDNCGGLLM